MNGFSWNRFKTGNVFLAKVYSYSTLAADKFCFNEWLFRNLGQSQNDLPFDSGGLEKGWIIFNVYLFFANFAAITNC